MTKKFDLISLIKIVGILLLINAVSYFYHFRFDLTQDNRYTLSEETKNILQEVNNPTVIDVYLEGTFPNEFKKLQGETRQILEEISAQNSNITFVFQNPLEVEEERVATMKKFYDKGMMPMNITVNDKGKQSQEVVFPWAVVSDGKKFAKVQLLKNLIGASAEEQVISSVQHLEYAFADAINKVAKEKQKKIAVIKGNGELDDIYIADFLKSIRESYYIGPITLDSVEKQSEKTLKVLQKYDLALIAKPTEPFSDKEKQVLDQYLIHGGKIIWLAESSNASMTQLYNEEGQMLASSIDLNVTDMFFKYGFRINPSLVKDIQCTPIKLSNGEGTQQKMELYPWLLSPFVYPSIQHPIVKNIEGVKYDFCSPIELLKNNIKKTVLLESSKNSKLVGLPSIISLDMVTEEPKKSDYANGGYYPLAVLLEGKFTSVYKNRVLPYKDKNFRAEGKDTQMIVISDGDVIKNQVDGNRPLELGFDKWSNQTFGNKEFLQNAINFLLDDSGIINIRSKDVQIALLQKENVYNDYKLIQATILIVPIVLLAVFGFVFYYLRKKKYAKVMSNEAV